MRKKADTESAVNLAKTLIKEWKKLLPGTGHLDMLLVLFNNAVNFEYGLTKTYMHVLIHFNYPLHAYVLYYGLTNSKDSKKSEAKINMDSSQDDKDTAKNSIKQSKINENQTVIQQKHSPVARHDSGNSESDVKVLSTGDPIRDLSRKLLCNALDREEFDKGIIRCGQIQCNIMIAVLYFTIQNYQITLVLILYRVTVLHIY